MTWTPDSRIVYSKASDGGLYTLWIIDADGRNEKQLTYDSGFWPTVKPDGRYIIAPSRVLLWLKMLFSSATLNDSYDAAMAPPGDACR